MLETASVQALFSHSKAGTWQQLVRDLGSVAGPQPGLGAAGKLLNLAKPQLPYLVMGMMALTLQASYAVSTGRAALLLISPLKWIVNNKVMLSTGLALAVGRGPFQGGVCIREGVCPLGALLPVGIVRVLAMTGLNAGLVLRGVMDAVRVQAVC